MVNDANRWLRMPEAWKSIKGFVDRRHKKGNQRLSKPDHEAELPYSNVAPDEKAAAVERLRERRPDEE